MPAHGLWSLVNAAVADDRVLPPADAGFKPSARWVHPAEAGCYSLWPPTAAHGGLKPALHIPPVFAFCYTEPKSTNGMPFAIWSTTFDPLRLVTNPHDVNENIGIPRTIRRNGSRSCRPMAVKVK